MRGAVPTLAWTVAIAAGCAAAPSRAPVPMRAAPPARQFELGALRATTFPAWTYWEPVEVPLVVAPLEATDLSASPLNLIVAAGLEERWIAAPGSLRDAVSARGFSFLRVPNPAARLGDFYTALQEARIPFVLTMDTLFFLAHIALDRAFAEVDAYVLAPLVSTLLHRLDARLESEGRTPVPDLAAPYSMARSVVAVALAMAESSYVPPPSIARVVAAEREHVLSHDEVAWSPVLGAPVDYTAMAPRGTADGDEVHVGWYRAVSWLENAAFVLEGTGERGVRGRVDVATARVQACAALLLARALDDGVDSVAARAWRRIEQTSELAIGDADDLTPRDLADAVARAQLDVRSVDWLRNVVRLDRVRHGVSRGRAGATFKLLGARSTPDGEVLKALVSPAVGRRQATADPTIAATRAFPSALDVAAWLGSGEARAVLHDAGEDAYERYDETLDRLRRARPSVTSPAAPSRHRTPYFSLIEAIETWLAPSTGDAVQPGTSTVEWRKRKADVALAAWTELRHDATTLTRIARADVITSIAPPAPASVPVFVEPHAEAIAELEGAVRQATRALNADGALRSGSQAQRVLEEVDNLLWIALGAAVYQTADESLPPELEEALWAVPARIRALETAVGGSGAADVRLIADVHVDGASSRVLEEGTGPVEEAWLAMREPRTHRLWVALGAWIAHGELQQPAARRLTDGAWRARLIVDGSPPAGALERGYATDPGVAVQAAASSSGTPSSR